MQRNMIKDKKQNVNKIDNTYIACPMSRFVQYPVLSLCTINVLSISLHWIPLTLRIPMWFCIW